MATRPVPVWAIFAISVSIFCYAVWSLVGILRTGIFDYGVGGLAVSMIPAAVLLAAGVSLFALTRWAILFAALNLLVVASFFLVEGALLIKMTWLPLSIGALGYAIWLRRTGILT